MLLDLYLLWYSSTSGSGPVAPFQATPPLFLSTDFKSAFLNLMPRGRAWPRDPDSIITKTIACLAPTYERQTASLAALIADSFPSYPVQLLPEWELTLGLPNPFAGTQTIAQRQVQVVGKFANYGGQTVTYFLEVLTSLGFMGATITEYVPCRAGIATCVSPCMGDGWAFTWLITAPNLSIQYLTCLGSCDESLYEITGAYELEYLIEQYAPAHTKPLFAIA